jgi:hypothetical protein
VRREIPRLALVQLRVSLEAEGHPPALASLIDPSGSPIVGLCPLVVVECGALALAVIVDPVMAKNAFRSDWMVSGVLAVLEAIGGASPARSLAESRG